MAETVAIITAVFLGLAFLTVVSAGVAVLVPRLMPGKPTPEEILRERYARGEIDALQFEEMRQRLAGSGRPASRAA